MNKIKRRDLFKIIRTRIISFLLFVCFVACNSENIPKKETQVTDTIIPQKKDTLVIIIDSVKMHAFDEIYFGTKNELSLRLKNASKSTLNGKEYYFSFAYDSLGRLSELTVVSDMRYFEEANVKKELEAIKNIISAKYSNATSVNRTFKLSIDADSKIAQLYSGTEELNGKPYKHIKYSWDTPYKTIEMGYEINYPRKGVAQFNNPYPDKISYRVLLEIKSKIIKSPIEVKKKSEDTKKF